MEIDIQHVGKKYSREWVFREFSFYIPMGSTVGISGLNGSGKSTLIRLLSGLLTPDEGKVLYTSGDKTVEEDHKQRYFSLYAPYVGLPSDMTVAEATDFYFAYNTMLLTREALWQTAEMEGILQKRLGQLSTGTRQRLLLYLAIETDAPLLFLDEPGANLDDQRQKAVLKRIEHLSGKKTIVIASNDAKDRALCPKQLSVGAGKISE